MKITISAITMAFLTEEYATAQKTAFVGSIVTNKYRVSRVAPLNGRYTSDCVSAAFNRHAIGFVCDCRMIARNENLPRNLRIDAQTIGDTIQYAADNRAIAESIGDAQEFVQSFVAYAGGIIALSPRYGGIISAEIWPVLCDLKLFTDRLTDDIALLKNAVISARKKEVFLQTRIKHGRVKNSRRSSSSLRLFFSVANSR